MTDKPTTATGYDSEYTKLVPDSLAAYLVDGQWLEPVAGRTIDVVNPVNLETIGNVPDWDRSEAALAVPGWPGDRPAPAPRYSHGRGGGARPADACSRAPTSVGRRAWRCAAGPGRVCTRIRRPRAAIRA